jgi:homoserine dehydrogenase
MGFLLFRHKEQDVSTQPKLELVPDALSPDAPTQAAKVAIVGFGTVGRSVAEILSYTPDPRLRLTHVFNRDVERKRVSWLNENVEWTDDIESVLNSDVEIIVETVGGLHPAEEWVRKALLRGKSVITANKQLIAHRGRELAQLAFHAGEQLLFGASVAGGVPVLLALQEGLAGDRLVGISGILNGTCNYILSRMEAANVSFDAALLEAQQFGFAEADPSSDLNGDDAAAKLAILAQIGLKAYLSPTSIRTTPVTSVEAVDFSYARELGCTIRQVSRVSLDRKKLFAAVEPALVRLDSSLARVQSSQNVVVASGKYGGNTAFLGHGAGGHPTAVAVISDLIAASQGRSHAEWIAYNDPKAFKVSSDFTTPHYVRFVVKDRPGIIATIASVLSERGINIDAILQRSGYAKAELPFVVTLEPCGTSILQEALTNLSASDFLVKPPVHFPILR